MPTGSYRWNPDCHVRTVRSGQYRGKADTMKAEAREVDAFATLNCSKTKRISAADVERHLRSMGVSVPVTTSSAVLGRGDGAPASDIDSRQIYESHNTPAPRNRVEV